MEKQQKILLVGGSVLVAASLVALFVAIKKNKRAGGKNDGSNGGNQPTFPQPPPTNDYASPGNDFIPGKTVYAATPYTYTWTEPEADEGWFGGAFGGTKQYHIPLDNIAGWIIDGPMKSTDPDDHFQWYKIRVYTVPPDPVLVYGYVREDVIKIK